MTHPTVSNSDSRHTHGIRAHWWRRAINWLKANKEAWDPLATICVGGVAAVLATLLTTYYTRKQTELQTAHEFSAVYLALGEKEKKVPAIRSLSVYADTFEENTLDLLVDMLNDEEFAVKRAAVETLGRISRKNSTTVRARLHKELQKANHPAAAGLALAEIDSQSTNLAAGDLKSDAQQVYLSFGRDSDSRSKGDCAESIAQFILKDSFGDQTMGVVQSLIDNMADEGIYQSVLRAFGALQSEKKLRDLLSEQGRQSLRSHVVECIKNTALGDELRLSCSKILGDIGNADDASALASLPPAFFSGEIGRKLVNVIGDLGDSGVLPALKKLKRNADSASLQRSAQNAIDSVTSRASKTSLSSHS